MATKTEKALKPIDKQSLDVAPIKIYVTSNYDMFTLSEYNREVSVSPKLVESIKSNNWTKYNPILIDSAGVVVDGQHRLLACMELKIPVYFLIAEDIVVNDAADINQATKNWATTDYIAHYTKRGYPAYVKMGRLARHYGLHITNLLALAKASSDKNETVTVLTKAGKFEFRLSDAKVKDLLDNFEVFRQFAPEFADNTIFFKAYVRIASLPNYDHSHMVKQLKLASGYLNRQPSQQLQIENILKVYNYNQQKKLKLDRQSKKVDDEHKNAA